MTSDYHGQRVKVDNLQEIFDGDNLIGRFKLSDGQNVLVFVRQAVPVVAAGGYADNGITLTVKRAVANVAQSQTDSSVVTAVAGAKLRVLAAFAVAGATATNLTFNTQGSGAGTAISPLLANAANGGEVLPMNPLGWFETNGGEALTVTTGAGSTTGIHILYVEVPVS